MGLILIPTISLQKVKNASHLFTGITDAHHDHGEAWHFAAWPPPRARRQNVPHS